MSDDLVTKSEDLAASNLRRLLEQLRTERNEALALIQIRGAALNQARSLLREIRESPGLRLDADLVARIDTSLASE